MSLSFGLGVVALLSGCPGGGDTGSGGTSGTAGTGGASGTGGAGEVTWTLLYNTIFGPNGTSSCAANGGCHTVVQSGFKCGTTKALCYKGMVDAGLISPGAEASSSVLVTKGKSPLCGPLGGGMPKIGKCVTEAQVAKIQAWLDGGGEMN